MIGAQLVAPYLSGNLLTGVFALFCLVVAGRFAVPHWFEPLWPTRLGSNETLL